VVDRDRDEDCSAFSTGAADRRRAHGRAFALAGSFAAIAKDAAP
jgi:hypothetical protein